MFCCPGNRLYVARCLIFSWLRSPNSNTNNVATLTTDGSLSNNNYNNNNGLRPDLPRRLPGMTAV